LERSESPLVTEELKPFLRDLYDHGVQVLDIIESLRDVLSGLRDLYQTTLDHRMNEIMKVLTIIGTIFIPLTFIAGIYGMNFDNMPELHATYGYPIALGVMVVLALGLLYYFRRKRWIWWLRRQVQAAPASLVALPRHVRTSIVPDLFGFAAPRRAGSETLRLRLHTRLRWATTSATFFK